MLGLWTGLSVFTVLAVGLHMAYGMTIEAARSLVLPVAISMTLLLGLVFIGYARYRKSVLAELDGLDPQNEENQDSDINWSNKIHQLDPIIQNNTMALQTPTTSNAILELENKLEKEKALREETELHLRITRKALSVAQNNFTATPEDVTSQTVLPAKQAETLELNVATLQRELVQAKREIRLHVAARAKALSTANKSVAFARQSIELRARLETELDSAHAALSVKQSTIGSLINRLEHERRLTDDELAALAQNVAVNDPLLQPQAGNSSGFGHAAQRGAQFTSGS